jgi:hypothetical protein
MPGRSKQLWLLLLALTTGLPKSFRKPKRHLRAAVVEDLRSGQNGLARSALVPSRSGATF